MALIKFIAEPRALEIGIDEDNVPNDKDIIQYSASYGMWFSRSLDNAGIVMKSLYDANSILIATADDTPIVLTIPVSTFVGRKATGDISAMSATESRVVLGLAVGDSPEFTTVKLSGLTDDYIPYHVNDTTGLANGPTKTNVDSAVSLKHTAGTDTALGTVGTKNPPVDADLVIYRDSTASFALVTSTWAQIKAFLKTYFDTLYGGIWTRSMFEKGWGELLSPADFLTFIHIGGLFEEDSSSNITPKASPDASSDTFFALNAADDLQPSA